jgi:hypothetical protein
MTIETSASPRAECDVKYLGDQVVALQTVEHCGKIYTIKTYLDKSWEHTDENSAKLAGTIQTVKQILDIFMSQLGDDSFITLTNNNKLFIGEGIDVEGQSYDYSFRDFFPAHKIQVLVGEVDEEVFFSPDDLSRDQKSDVALLEEELDFDEPLSSNFSESDILLSVSKLEEAERRDQSISSLKSHVPINKSRISSGAQKDLQGETKQYTHMIDPCSDGNSGLSAFFCVLAGAVAQKDVELVGFKAVLRAAEAWAESSGIVGNKLLMGRLENGLGRLNRLYEDPSQGNLRKLVKDPIDHSSVNFALRQLALMTIYYHPDMVKNTIEGVSHDQAAIEKQQKLLFNQTKIPGNEVGVAVVAILQQLFRLEYSVFSEDSTQESPSVVQNNVSSIQGSVGVNGIAIYFEKGHYYPIFNQRVFQFV